MTIFGWDASHYDAVPSGAKVVSEGFKFFTHKAGGDANDAELAAWWKSVKPYRDRMLLGAYWVLYPGTPVKRADAFLARLDSQCPGWRDKPFILQVDCEKWGGKASTVPNKADIKAFCDRLKAKTGLVPLVYAPKWVYGDKLKGLGYPLWASSYVSGSGTASGLYPGDGSSRWGAYSGATPVILQYTSSAKIAGQTTCDANAYKGTLAQLTALVAPAGKTTVPAWPVPATSATAPVLRNGSTGTAVTALQKGLNRVFPAYSDLTVDGKFGDGTEKVIREFQKRDKLTSDGIVGATTRKHLNGYGVKF